jgi:2-succinyl-6-hydroxy-2, 4-cyclohexadiene-1-carbox ylic acid synthase/2-oxoglutarate decarboxy [...]
MNYYLVPNLKIIVINNKGGGIFRFIPGPDTTPNLEQFFETKHSWNAKYICKAFDVDYTQISSDDDFQSKILAFLNGKTDKTSLLEIHTPNEKNAIILRKYFKYLKNGANDSP